MKKHYVLLSLIILSQAFFVPDFVHAAVNSLNGQTGATQTFANDTNIVINSSGDVHTLGWSGLLAASRGGTGVDLSGFANGSILFNNNGILGEDSWLNFDTTNRSLILGGGPAQAGTLKTPDATSSGQNGIYLDIKSGNGLGTGSGGGIEIIPGNAGDDGSTGGSVLIVTGTASNGDAGHISLLGNEGTSGNGGSVEAIAGPSSAEYKYGGYAYLEAGNGYYPGDVYIKGGDATEDNANPNGNIILQPGKNNYDNPQGNVLITSINGNNLVIERDPLGGDPVRSTLDFYHVNADSTFSFPDGGGTVITDNFLSNQDLSFYGSENFTNPVITFVGGTNNTVYIGNDGVPGCLVLGDSDGSGVTYVTANDGVLSASDTPPANCN